MSWECVEFSGTRFCHGCVDWCACFNGVGWYGCYDVHVGLGACVVCNFVEDING